MNNPLKSSADNLGTANLGRMNKPIPSEAKMTKLRPNLADVPLKSPQLARRPIIGINPTQMTATFWESQGGNPLKNLVQPLITL